MEQRAPINLFNWPSDRTRRRQREYLRPKVRGTNKRAKNQINRAILLEFIWGFAQIQLSLKCEITTNHNDMKKILIQFVMFLLPMVASADGIEIEGIYYNLKANTKFAEVTSHPDKYEGCVVIPQSVIYKDCKYSVTSIGSYAFENCTGLLSVIIPTSVTSIGDRLLWRLVQKKGEAAFCNLSLILNNNHVLWATCPYSWWRRAPSEWLR